MEITKKNTLIDNSESLKMVDALKECFNDTEIKIAKIATGYWDIPGLTLVIDELRGFIERGGSLQLLIGTDPVARSYQLKEIEEKNLKFPYDFIRRDLRELKVKDEYQSVIDLLISNIGSKGSEAKIQICMLPKREDGDAQFLHAKCYIFLGGDSDKGIIGSSNFTQKGLEDNNELNVLENGSLIQHRPDDQQKRKGHNYWFEQLWATAEDWSQEFLEEVKKSPNGQEVLREKEEEKVITLTPYELYIRYLQDQFGEMVDGTYDEQIKKYLPSGYDSYQFQIDAVKQCFSIMKRYGGFLLGDVVGLGKTVVGTLIIKRFVEESSQLSHSPNVLILTPPSIRGGWVQTIEDFDKMKSGTQIMPYVDIVTTGKVQGIDNEFDDELDDAMYDADNIERLQNNKQYGLVMIDESHGFRNSETQKYKALDSLIGRILPTPYVALLSATPQNNSPKDLKNQLTLFIRTPKRCPLAKIPGGDFLSFFAKMEKEFQEQRNNANKAEQRRGIEKVSNAIRDCVLSELVVRRTRADIRENYSSDGQKLQFPSVKGPHRLDYTMDEELAQLFSDTMDCICPMDEHGKMLQPTENNIYFSRYAAIAYFEDNANKKLYEKRNLTVEGITRDLEKMMRILMVKRLESSFSAFKESLEHLEQNTRIMLKMLENDAVFVCPDIDINSEFRSKDDPNVLIDFAQAAANIRKKIERKGGNNHEFRSSDFTKKYRRDLEHDLELIRELRDRWSRNSQDPKFDKFKENLNNRLFDTKINNPHGYDKPRLVIFTEALSTQESIARYVKSTGHRVLSISAKNRKEKNDQIAANFDANYKGEKRDDYDVLVTTEVLAEGVNLHRANVILNYDAPWNSTRLMQRIGRVNRIGSREDAVQVFNFFPTGQGNATIHLIEKTYAKLQSFHILFGEDSKIFSDAEELFHVDLNKLIDGEASPSSKFIKELRAYQLANPKRYEQLLKEPWSKNLGGFIADGDKTLVVYKEEFSDQLLPILYDASAEKAKWKVVTSLEAMEYLQCSPDAQFVPHAPHDEKFLQGAHAAYIHHIEKRFGSASKLHKKALETLIELQKLYPNGKKNDLFARIRQLVDGGNTQAIKALVEFSEKRTANPSLFEDATEGIDLENWLIQTFDKMTVSVLRKRGKAEIALFEAK